MVRRSDKEIAQDRGSPKGPGAFALWLCSRSSPYLHSSSMLPPSASPEGKIPSAKHAGGLRTLALILVTLDRGPLLVPLDKNLQALLQKDEAPVKTLDAALKGRLLNHQPLTTPRGRSLATFLESPASWQTSTTSATSL